MDELFNEELVNSPSHHNVFSVETIEMARRIYGNEAVFYFLEISALKYKLRAGEKAGEPIDRELGKAKKCLEMAREYKQTPDELTDEQIRAYAKSIGFNVNIDDLPTEKKQEKHNASKLLNTWIKANYPNMKTLDGLAQLDYHDMENFAQWIVKQMKP
jgi:hypothetical protein